MSKKIFDSCEVAVIEVQPSYNTPVKLDGRAWIRVGPRRAVATGEEERRLLEDGTYPSMHRLCTGSTIVDLDIVRFQVELLPARTPGRYRFK